MSWERERVARKMAADGEFQATMTGFREPAQVEAEYVAAHTCGCHGWFPDWRCHVVQAARNSGR